MASRAGGKRDAVLVRRYFWQVVTLYGVAALTFAPLGLYFLQHPDSFLQRAGEIAAFNQTEPWARIGQAVIANVLQFFVPGRGDTAQFYNLPGRSVFDLASAVLAALGILLLLRYWRRPPALFLLTWFPVLLLPAVLATDRFPTLPRVLGVIPGVYFFAGVGAVALGAATVRVWEKSKIPCTSGLNRGNRSVALAIALAVLLPAAALLIHAGATYRDYFRLWGPSTATFDAFEGDMASAWRWMSTAAPKPAGHVYLSSDIYRHPTFMLLDEKATVTTYFDHRDPGLSWFDARAALPLPSPGQDATYLIGSSAPAAGAGAELLRADGIERNTVLAVNGTAALRVIEMAAIADSLTPVEDPVPFRAELGLSPLTEPITFTDLLTLTSAGLAEAPDGMPELRLLWHTAGPDLAEYPGYRLEIEAGDGQTSAPFDAFRPPEWVPGGRFLTWHHLETPVQPPARIRLRLLRAADGSPLATPTAPDGWHELRIG